MIEEEYIYIYTEEYYFVAIENTCLIHIKAADLPSNINKVAMLKVSWLHQKKTEQQSRVQTKHYDCTPHVGKILIS